MNKIINLTPEKNATRSVGGYVEEVVGFEQENFFNYCNSYDKLTKTEWLNFDSVVNESIVFMFVRNPYDRLVSSFIHTCLSLDYVLDNPEWYFDLPITKENQLKCFKNFCLDFSKGDQYNSHIDLQTRVIDIHVHSVLKDSSNFSIVPYIENGKIFFGKIENIESDLSKLVLSFGDTILGNIKPKVEHIGNNSTTKFSSVYQDWYDDELYDLMTPVFKKELEIFDYEF